MSPWIRGALALALCAALADAAAAEAGTGTVRLQSTSVGIGFGLSWGGGTLHYEGRDIPFELQGYKVADLGILHTRPTGSVENLEDVKDFEGQFSATEGALALGAGGTSLSLRNENGVVMRLSGLSYGLGLTLAAEGIHVKLGKIPPPPAPPEPPPVAAAPPPAPPPPEPNPCEETVTLPGVLFDFDSAHLTPAGDQAIDRAAKRLGDCSDQQVVIEGYTDSTGSPAHNQALSQRRANTVKYALGQHGVSLDRIDAVGRGASDPVAPNDTEEGRAQNRRAEISTP